MSAHGKQTRSNKKKQYNWDAPVAQLPNEILVSIFLEANSEPVSISIVNTIKGSRGAWGNSRLPETTGYCNMAVVISHVCRQWRTLSLGMPDLWTTIYYVEYLSDSHEILQRLDAYLERSGAHLLDIWIDLRGSRHILVDRNQSLMTKILPHISRWRSFAFFPDNTSPLLNLFNQLQHLAAPNLETFYTPAAITDELALRLSNASGSADTSESGAPLIFKKGAPKLSIVRMDGSAMFLNLLSSSNISILYLHNEDSTVVQTVNIWLPSIQSLANLTHLTLDRVSIRHYHSPLQMGFPIPVIFPNLIHFRLCNISIHRTEFSRFQLPRLETLTFYKVEYEGDGTHHPVDIPNLHSLFLVDSNISGSGISLTRLTSTITTIVLSDSRTRSSGIRPLQLLNYDDTQQGWPMLQDITVNLRNVGKFGLDFYLQCLQTRPQDPPITLRINSSLLADWQTRFAGRLAILQDLCRIETLDASNPFIPSPWPVDTHNGALKSLYEKLDPPFIKTYSTYYSDV